MFVLAAIYEVFKPERWMNCLSRRMNSREAGVEGCETTAWKLFFNAKNSIVGNSRKQATGSTGLSPPGE
jgi:hypothetical protein